MRLIVVIFALFVSSGIFSQISQPLCFDYDGGGAGAFVGGVGGGASGIITGTGNALYFQDADLADALGRQTRMKTALGQWTTYDYDILNRVTEQNRPEGSSVYTYYGSGLGGSTNQLEKIVTYGGVEESYTYDGVGRVLTRTDKVDNEVWNCYLREEADLKRIN